MADAFVDPAGDEPMLLAHLQRDRPVRAEVRVRAMEEPESDREAEDKTTDLALLRVYGVPDLVPAAFADDGAKTPDMMLLGIADPQSQGGGGAITAVI